MIESYFRGLIPDGGVGDKPLEQSATRLAGAVRTHYDNYRFSDAVQETWQIISLVDFMLVQQKPWARIAEPSERPAVAAVLRDAAEAIRFASVLAHPVIPEATQKIWKQLGQSGRLAEQRIDQLEWGGLKPGTKIGKPEAVFPRVDKKEAYERIETMENEIRNPGATPPVAATTAAAASPTSATPAPAGAKITIDDFAKVELRVGRIESAERIQGADKLLKIMVNIGDEVRQVLAGIALAYAPENLVGRKVVVVTNLAPRKMRGLESNGMLLAASTADGNPVLCTFAEDIAVGSKVK